MNSFHGARKKRRYFEGWYLKQQSGGETIALIPAVHIDQKGIPTASLQIITDEAAHSLTFPIQDFQADPRRFCVQIAGNTFCEKGILLNLHTKQLSLTGKLRFGPFTPPISDIMGPFRFVPFLQCRHSVISLSHPVNGFLELNGKRYSFENGTGYLEGDRGRSFPATYLWSQCNWQELGPCSVMPSQVFLFWEPLLRAVSARFITQDGNTASQPTAVQRFYNGPKKKPSSLKATGFYRSPFWSNERKTCALPTKEPCCAPFGKALPVGCDTDL